VTRPALLGIRHVALWVGDLTAAERFWTEVMGYAVEWRPDPDNVYLSGGRDNLALHRRTAGPAAVATAVATAVERSVLDHIGLAVPEAGDVDAWAAHLEAQAVPLERAPKTHRDGSRSLYFEGPEKLLIQIIHHAPLSAGP
jgi:catechol 2,3-dioxygenase-like lactoylglutathione lyase family enzyme